MLVEQANSLKDIEENAPNLKMVLSHEEMIKLKVMKT